MAQFNRPSQAVLDSAVRAYHSRFDKNPCVISWAPGRINIIGEHTDYTGGLAIPAAINRWVVMVLGPRHDQRGCVYSTAFKSTLEGPITGFGPTEENWTRYVAGAVDTVVENSRIAQGFNALITGDIPLEAGLSSSAALLTACLKGFWDWGEIQYDTWKLVTTARDIEHASLGVPCGLLDPISSVMSQPGHASLIDFHHRRVEPIPISLPDAQWIVVHTGKERRLADSAYATRVRECREGLTLCSAQDPSIQHYRDIPFAMLGGTAPWQMRLRHFAEENTRVEMMDSALRDHDLQLIGELLRQSHASLRDQYEVSCLELDTLVEIATTLPGWYGGRMMGGGFGGCTLHLVARDCADIFKARILERYSRSFPQHSPTALTLEMAAGAATEAL